MLRPPPSPKRTYPPFPYPTPFRPGHTGPVETQHCPQQTLGDRLEACRLTRPGKEMELSVPAGAGRDEKAIGTQEQPIRRGFVEAAGIEGRSEEHTSELQSLMRISYAVFCLKKKNRNQP